MRFLFNLGLKPTQPMFKEGYITALPGKEKTAEGVRVAKAVGTTFKRGHLQLEDYQGSKGHEAPSQKPNRTRDPNKGGKGP